MGIRIEKSGQENESKNSGNSEKWLRSICPAFFMALLVLVLLAFLVLNLPGRYKPIVVSNQNDVLILDTVKGNLWCYSGNIDSAEITYQGKLKAGEKVPERTVVH